MCNFIRQDYFVYSQGQNEIEKEALISDQDYSKKSQPKATEINVRLKDVYKARDTNYYRKQNHCRLCVHQGNMGSYS